MLVYPFGLLQLLTELLHNLTVFLSQVLDLGLMAPPLFLNGLFQHGHLLLTFCPGNHMHTSHHNTKQQDNNKHKHDLQMCLQHLLSDMHNMQFILSFTLHHF